MNHLLIKTLLTGILSLGLGLGSTVALAAPLKVVSSFSILADIVSQVGGELVESVAIVGPEGDAHSFEPRPSDVQTLQDADLLIINGANFEAWLPKLVQAAGYQGKVVEAIKGVPLRTYQNGHQDTHAHQRSSHDHGIYDPHAWQSLEHAQIYVHNIAEALIEAEPYNKKYYLAQALQYEKAMQKLHTSLLQEFEKLPVTQRTVVSSHDAFSYLGQAYGIEFMSLLGASNQAEPSAKELAELIVEMRDHQVKAVFIENISSPKLIEQIARETGATLGKHLYSDALAKAPHRADSYLGMMQWNGEALLEALKAP